MPPVPVNNAVIFVPGATPAPLRFMPTVSGDAPGCTPDTVNVVPDIDAVTSCVNSIVSTNTK